MTEWYIWVIFILGALCMFGGAAWWIIWQTDREISGKILVEMRTKDGKKDEFLAGIRGDFIDLPDKKNKYLKKIVSESGIKSAVMPLSYKYDNRATVDTKYPSPKGVLSFLSRPIDTICYNEGDPEPLPTIALETDEDGNVTIKRYEPLDSAALVAIASDETFAAALKIVSDELDRERRKTMQIAAKFVPAWVHGIHIVLTLGLIGAVVYMGLYIMDGQENIAKGLGL